jgi:gamma-glutamylcyclotransferase (GGCT)/AIG2-like uncharacterized protein YtfP
MSDIKKGDLIFVYGTLRQGERADLSASQSHFSARFVGEDRITGEIFNIGSYPGLTLIQETKEDELIRKFVPDWFPAVIGEVFKAMDSSLGDVLDAYEGYPYLYDRTEVVTEHGRKVWVYTYNGAVTSEMVIPSGDWKLRHSSEREAA